MVTRVPGGRGGCSRSSCPPERPTRAPKPQLMPTHTVHPPSAAVGASWGCHEYSLHCAQSMSAAWVLPGAA